MNRPPLSIRPLVFGLVSSLVLAATPVRAQDEPVPDAAASFFDAGTVHELRVAIHGDDWRRLRETYLENTYYPADVTWNGMRVRNVGIRSRGNASRSDKKPGLRVDMDRYVSDQRFLGLKSFVLDNLVQDNTLVKERVAMRLFERMGLPAPREAHVRLYVNDEFAGVYTIVEAIDKDFITRAFQWREAQTGQRERDGVIFEYQWQSEYDFSYLGPDLEHYASRFEPKTHESDSPDALYGPLRDMCRLATDSSDADFPDIVDAYIDLQQWVRYVAVESFIAEVDGMLGFAGINNFYLYRFERGIVSQVIPWDKDLTFADPARSIWTNSTNNVLMRRAMQSPELRALYLETLSAAAQLAAAPVDDIDPRGWLEREVDGAVTQIKGWAEADRNKPQSNDDFAAAAELLREFARTRPAFIECEVANARASAGAEPRTCAPATPTAGTTSARTSARKTR